MRWVDTLTWQNTDKSEWEKGPWTDEPDKAQWIDEATGLDCLIVRGPSGALCGYVGVPELHPAYGKDYDTVPVDCHGGLTFADKCRPVEDPSTGICHLSQHAANKNVWWLGFDCAHLYDFMPGYGFRGYMDTYRNFGYVKRECEQLASQLGQMKEAAQNSA